MNEVEKPDYATLRWVKEGLDETIQLARQALENYADGGFQGEGIDRFREHIHQLLGTLRMVQVHGGAMLVEEMEEVAKALSEGRVQGSQRLAESLMLGLVQLPGYLQRLQSGQPDIPLALLPVLNDLRSARGLAPASEIVLYAPNLDRLVEREPVIPGSGNPQLPELVQGLRNQYHKGLLAWYRHTGDAQGLHQVLEVVRAINAAAGTRRLRRLMDAAEALVITLEEGDFTADDHVKQLFGRLDRVFKTIMAEGEEAAMTHFPMELLKYMLYFVSRSHSRDTIVQSVKRTADLANSFPEHMEQTPVGGGLDEEVLAAVFEELHGELGVVQENLDLYIRGDWEETHRLQGLGERLRRVADTLGMLGKGNLREKLVEVATRLDEMAAGALQPDDEQLMALATVLVQADRVLGMPTQAAAEAVEEEDTEREEYDEAVLREAFSEFSRIKEGLETYLHDAGQRHRLDEVAQEVHKLGGIFDVAGLSELAALLRNAEPELQRLQTDDSELDPHQRGALVDFFAALDYYLEARLDGRSNLEAILDQARAALEQFHLDESEFQGEIPPEFIGESAAKPEGVPLYGDDSEVEDAEAAADDESESATVGEEPAETSAAIEENPSDEVMAEGAASEGDETAGAGITPMDEIDPEIADIFLEEAQEELEVIGEQYPRWRQDFSDQTALEIFRRSFHTLKGSGRMVGAMVIGEFAWSVENLLNRIMDGTVEPTPPVVAFLDRAVAAMPVLLEAQAKGEPAPVDVESLRQRGFELAEGAWAEETEAASDATAEALPESAEPEAAPAPVLELADALHQVFRVEAANHLETLENHLADCAEACPVPSEVVRAIHTLRGSAHLAGLNPLAELSAEMEHYCTHLQQLDQPMGQEEQALMRRFIDTMTALLAAINRPGVELPDWGALRDDIHAADQTLPEVISELEAPSDSQYLGESDGETDLKDSYLEEAARLLETLDGEFERWLAHRDEAEAVDAIHRALHGLKGGARNVGFAALGDLAEGLELYFDLLQETDGAVDDDTRHALRGLVETFENALDDLHLNGRLPDLSDAVDRARTLARELEQLLPETGEGETQREVPLEEEPESILLADEWEEESEQHPESATLPASRFTDTLQSAQPQPLPEDLDPELLELFLEEAGEITERLEEHLPAWEREMTSRADIDAMMRGLHTLKGNARFAGLFTLGDLAHALESVFRGLAEGRIEADDTLAVLVRNGVDRLETSIELLQKGVGFPDPARLTEMIEAAARGEPVDLSQLEAGTTEITAVTESLLQIESSSLQLDASSLQQDSSSLYVSSILTESELAVEQQSPPDDDAVVPFPAQRGTPEPTRRRPPPLQAEEEQAGKGERVRVRAELLDQLVNHAGEVSIYRARLERHNVRVQQNLEELNATIARLRSQLRALELETEAQIRSRHERDFEDQRYEDFDPLEMDRYSTLQQLSRALSETISDLSNIGETLSEQTRDADTLLLQQERITNDLQDGLLRSRMVPFKRQASRLQRVVRQTAQTLGKQAELEVRGAEGEIDRTILNRMVGPLEHLLRNAVAHGIEPPEKRRRLGKPERGRVQLTMVREGSDVVLTISDDGAGLDAGAIRRKAVASGLLEPGTEIDEGTLYQFILQPGFTTAGEVTQVAGRGVGMDAVVSEIKQLGGTLEIDSKPGRGSTFTIRLPFTLAISEALLVRVADEVYAIPHGATEVIIRVARDDLLACYRGESEGIHYGDQLYPVRYMGSMLGLTEPVVPDNVKWLPLLLARAGEQRMAIQVDHLIGNQQVVVKSIGAQLAGVRWFTGGTILADGQIALLVDMHALIRSAAVTQSVAEAEPQPEEKGITVMVVDDSITVRKVTSRLLERHNMQVITARDGVDAITVLQEKKPDIMLLDIEMPRMDGFELARHMRNTPELQDIPIIMITSRTGEKHRQRAAEIGVERYLGKPYQENDLLENIYGLLGERLQ